MSALATDVQWRLFRFAERLPNRLGDRAGEMFDALERRPTELAWIRACSAYEVARLADAPLGTVRDPLSRQTFAAMERCVVAGRISAGQLALLTKHGRTGRPLSGARTPGRRCAMAQRVWDRAIGILHVEMNQTVYPAPLPLDRPAPPFFYGTGGTKFADAANAWWWTLDCLEARADGTSANRSLRTGRPCDPDDVVNALRRLELSALHARTIVAWGKQRTVPEEGSEARRLWDEVMTRLTVVLRIKGIVRLGPTDVELMDLPLTALLSIPLPPARFIGERFDNVSAARRALHPGRAETLVAADQFAEARCAGDCAAAPARMGTAGAERQAVGAWRSIGTLPAPSTSDFGQTYADPTPDPSAQRPARRLRS
jgi:hypothetical protein